MFANSKSALKQVNLPQLAEISFSGNKNLHNVVLPKEVKDKIKIDGFDKISWQYHRQLLI